MVCENGCCARGQGKALLGKYIKFQEALLGGVSSLSQLYSVK